MLTATNAVGRGYDAVVDALFAAGEIDVVIPVVGECDDSWLDDIARRWVTTAEVRAGTRRAPSAVRSPKVPSAPAPG